MYRLYYQSATRRYNADMQSFLHGTVLLWFSCYSTNETTVVYLLYYCSFPATVQNETTVVYLLHYCRLPATAQKYITVVFQLQYKITLL